MYKIIDDLPVGLNFTNKSKEEIQMYGEWFKRNHETRLQILSDTVKSEGEFEKWQSDFTPDSLKFLGKWLTKNVKTEKLPPDKFRNKRESTPSYISIKDWEMTTETYSKLVDVGIYFGDVFIHTHTDLRWVQYFSKIKNDVNHGHMVIKSFGPKELNPIRTMYIVGLEVAEAKTNENCLIELYEFWKKYLPKG
jgi:hypothetical protein